MFKAGAFLLLALLSGLTQAGAQPGSSPAAAPVAVSAVAAEGTQFRLTLSDGRVLRSPELVGAAFIVRVGQGQARVRLAAVEREPRARDGDVWLHTLMVVQADGTETPLCRPGPDGKPQGFPLASRMLADGAVENTPEDQFEILCTGGSRAKCVRFGYRPWKPEEADLYAACNRMVRADYCGQGEGTTRDGMPIDPYDDQGIQIADRLAEHAFEAGWTKDGAVCVSHVRVKENTSLAKLAQQCPRLADRVGPGCNEDTARSLGARLFNRSVP